MTKPFRFAVQATRATSAGQWIDLARKVEDLGYSTLFLADHYLGKGSASKQARWPPQHFAPLTAMATAAAVTTTLRVGCRVFCVDYHVPAVLVKEAATLDLLSDGRLEFGLGAGWSAPEYRAMGLRFAEAASRVDKLEEVIALYKAHAAGDPLEIDGEFVTAQGYAGSPEPVQKPHPPLMIGGSRQRVLGLAGREADIASISTVPFDPVDGAGRTPHQEAVRRTAHVRAAAGDRFGELDIESSPFFTAVTADRGGAVDRIAAIVGAPPETLIDHPNVLIGTAAEISDRLVQRRDTLGVNYLSIQQSEIESFAPVVARLAGQ